MPPEPAPATSADNKPDAPARAVPPLLDVRSVTKRFGGVVAVRGASFQVAPGRVTSLIGPNGAGKTTLFNTITGAIAATEGSILLAAAATSTSEGAVAAAPREILRLRPDQITRLGVARTFQNIRLFAGLSVLENVKIGLHARTRTGVLGALMRGPFTRREERDVHQAALEYLEFCGLGAEAGLIAGELPYGHQRRLEVARALAGGPRLLLLDEPAAGMNPSESQALLALVRRVVAAGITVLLIEHDMKVVVTISDHVIVLDHGEVIAAGAPAEVMANPQVIEAYLGAGHAGHAA